MHENVAKSTVLFLYRRQNNVESLQHIRIWSIAFDTSRKYIVLKHYRKIFLFSLYDLSILCLDICTYESSSPILPTLNHPPFRQPPICSLYLVILFVHLCFRANIWNRIIYKYLSHSVWHSISTIFKDSFMLLQMEKFNSLWLNSISWCMYIHIYIIGIYYTHIYMHI